MNPRWLLSSEVSSGLVGRVRVSREGVNATLGGRYSALTRHCTLVGKTSQCSTADFKLARVEEGSSEWARCRDAQLLRETGFERLSGRVVREVVSYGVALPSWELPVRRRLKNEEWDCALLQPGALALDVRNGYESAIGRFECRATNASSEVSLCVPATRSTTDFAKWLTQNADKFEGRSVLAYCQKQGRSVLLVSCIEWGV